MADNAITTLDTAFVDKYTTQSLAAGDAMGFLETSAAAVASTVVDIGTSLWNSAVVGIPKLVGADTKEYSASTFDLLDNVNSDWANFYRSNKDAVEVASFVGGMLLSGTAALKGMRMMQAGKVGYFPEMLKDSTQLNRIGELTAKLEQGAGATMEFNALRWKILGVDALQQTAQAAGMEVAMLATFNEHAMFEDYFKDPVKNFGISVLLGGVIGSGLGQITLRKTMSETLGEVASKAAGAVESKLVVIPHGLTENDTVLRMRANATQLAALEADQSVNPLTRELAKSVRTWTEGEAAILERDRIFSKALNEAPQETKEAVRRLMETDATFGVNTVDFARFTTADLTGAGTGGFPNIFRKAATFTAIEKEFPELAKLGQLARQGLVASAELERNVPNWKALMEKQFGVYYSPHFGSFIPLPNAKNYTRAVDMGHTQYSPTNVMRINADASFELLGRQTGTAVVDKQWIDALGSAHGVDSQSKIFMHATDLPTINAWVSKAAFAQENGIISRTKYFLTEAASDSQTAMQKAAKEVSLDELVAHLATMKEQYARDLLTAGASLQEISIRLNTSVTALEQHLLKKAPLQTVEGWRAYTSVDAISTDYLHSKGQMLKLTTNGSRAASLRFRNADMSANLDQKFLKQADRGIMLNAIKAVGSKHVEDLFLSLNADNAVWDILDSQLSNVVNQKAGSFFGTSSDFAARRMGDVGTIASISGQKYIGIMNTKAKEILTNLSATIHAHTSTQAGLNEINAIFTHLSGLSGYRNFDPKSGRLFVRIAGPDGALFEQPIKNSNIKGLLGSEISKGAQAILTEMKSVSEEMYKIKNTLNRIQGFKELDNIGLHIPTFNPNNKFMTYVIDSTTQDPAKKVRMLIGKSPEELATLERQWQAENVGVKGVTLVRKSEQEAFNAIQMRLDPMDMDFVDVNKFHSGASASAVRVVDDSLTGALVENLHNRVLHYSRQIQEMYLHDTMSTLDMMSAVNRGLTDAQPIAAKSVGLHQPEDAARAVKNMILGNNQLSNFSTWRNFNNSFSATIDYVSNQVNQISKAFRSEVDTKMPLAKKDFVKYSKELEQVGVTNPFKEYGDYLLFNPQKQEAVILTKAAYSNPEYPGSGATYIINKAGKDIGEVVAEYNPTTKNLRIESIYTDEEKRSLGVSALRDVFQQLKKEYPEAQTVSGNRVSGVREAWYSVDGGVEVTKPFPNAKQLSSTESYKQHIEQLRIDSMRRLHNTDYASAQQLIATGNSILSTFALRVMEMGQPVVNALSMPILGIPELMRNMPKTFLGNEITREGVGVAFPARVIYDGVRWRHSEAAKPYIERWIKEGFGQSIVSEASQISQLIYKEGKGTLGKVNAMLSKEDGIISLLSKPSDFAEKETRLIALSTGFQAARTAYPGISDTAANMFAEQFMNKVIGNYHSAQRPAMFQGQAGVALGLFQTYMLTWAQSTFRSIEEGAGKALGAQMLIQAGLFGTSSLPGYDIFSKTIASHFSDKHYDLTTGTYRALPNAAAEMVVYGLPASMGVGLYTRGDLQPRVPVASQNSPYEQIALVNVASQFYGATAHAMTKVMEAQGMSAKARALLEGLSMQSLSRPVARIAEIVPLPDGTGGVSAVGALSRQGNTVATSSEVWSTPGLLSRVLSSRGTEEQVKREIDYMASFHASLDTANRKKTTETLKTAIRAGSLSEPGVVDTIAAEYLRTGTATGWQAAMNEALATSAGGIDYKLEKRLKPDSPLMQMIKTNF